MAFLAKYSNTLIYIKQTNEMIFWQPIFTMLVVVIMARSANQKRL